MPDLTEESTPPTIDPAAWEDFPRLPGDLPDVFHAPRLCRRSPDGRGDAPHDDPGELQPVARLARVEHQDGDAGRRGGPAPYPGLPRQRGPGARAGQLGPGG